VGQRLATVLLCLGLLAGCGAKSPRSYPVPDSRRLEAELDHAWEATCRVLADRGYDIQRNDRAAGVIETDWKMANSDYAASVFLTQNEDRYSDCGKPGLWSTYRGKQVRLTVSLSPVGQGQTEVVVRAAFRTERTAFISQSPALLECRSRGRLEEEILLESQVRALGNQLQRFRRERY
jgi:hypothetical protein